MTHQPALEINNDDEPAKSPTSRLPMVMCLGLVPCGAKPELTEVQSTVAIQQMRNITNKREKEDILMGMW